MTTTFFVNEPAAAHDAWAGVADTDKAWAKDEIETRVAFQPEQTLAEMVATLRIAK